MQAEKESTKGLSELLDRAGKEDLDNLSKILFSEKYENKTVREIIDKLRYAGSHDIPFIIRRFKGVHYLEIVRDVAKHLKVDKVYWEMVDDVEVIEQQVVLKAWDIIWNKMSDEEKETIKQELEAEGFNGFDVTKGDFPVRSLGALLGTILGRMVLKLLAERIGLAFVGGSGAGPIGIVIAALLLVIDIAGPAYRKTVPAVIQIAYIRQKDKLADLGV